MHAVSRHGWLPETHATDPLPPLPAPAFGQTELSLADVRRTVLAHVAASMREHGDWRPAVDGLRCVSSWLWQRLSYDDQREFLATDARQWEVHRHRMAPSIGTRVHLCRRAGRLQVSAGEVVNVTARQRVDDNPQGTDHDQRATEQTEYVPRLDHTTPTGLSTPQGPGRQRAVRLLLT